MRLALMLRRVVLLAVAASAPWLPAQSFDLDRGREPVVSLDGLWRFHPGDSPTTQSSDKGQTPVWAASGFDDSGWPMLQSSSSWSTQGYPAMSGYGWYRFTVRIPAGEKPTSLLLAPIVTSFELYVDGKLAGGSGKMPTEIPATLFSFHLFPLTQAGSTQERNVQVAIRVWHSPIWSTYVGGGPFQAGHLAGDPKLLAIEQRHQQLRRNVAFVDSYSYSITAALVGFAILALLLFRPAEREYLWFAVMMLAQAADNALTVGQQIFSWPPVPIFDLSDGTLAAINILAAFCFFSRVLKAPAGVLGRACLALVILSPLPGVFYWPGWFSASASAATQLACLLPAVIWILCVLVDRTLRGNLDARLLLIPAVLDLGYYLADNLAIVLAQAGWTATMPRVLEQPLPLPPFTMQTGILLHLVFLLAMLIFLIRRFMLARRREERMASELEAARQVQLVLLPDHLDQCPGFTVESVYQPAEQVGGDFFQQIGDGQGGLSIVVGDVSGKGLPAAMMVSVLVGAIRAEATHSADPAALLRSLNDRMMGRSQSGFTTCLAAHISAQGRLTLANAGHLPPYLNGRELSVPGSLPLGILPANRYDSVVFDLLPGDRLTFVSDGVVEAQTKSGELFGFDRTCSISRSPATVIAETARLFGQSDDITVVTVEFSGVAEALEPVSMEA